MFFLRGVEGMGGSLSQQRQNSKQENEKLIIIFSVLNQRATLKR